MTLVERIEAATGPDLELDQEIALLRPVTTGTRILFSQWKALKPRGDETATFETFTRLRAQPYTASMDLAMTLLPHGACNHRLISRIGHGIEHFPDTAWGFGYHDQGRLKGLERAKEECEAVQKMLKMPADMLGAHIGVVATQFRWFECVHAATPALAICAAALKE